MAEAAPSGGQGARSALQGGYTELDSPDPAVRADAVQAIRRAKDAAAVPALLAHIEDPDQRTGLYIAQALVELAPAHMLVLLRATLWRSNADGRWRAALVLGERRDFRAIPALERALRDEEVLVSRTAAEALAKIGTTAAVNALVRSLQSERPSEVHAAMNGLLILGDDAVPALARALNAGDIQLEKSASTVLAYIGTPDALAAMQSGGAQ